MSCLGDIGLSLREDLLARSGWSGMGDRLRRESWDTCAAIAASSSSRRVQVRSRYAHSPAGPSTPSLKINFETTLGFSDGKLLSPRSVGSVSVFTGWMLPAGTIRSRWPGRTRKTAAALEQVVTHLRNHLRSPDAPVE